jgi:hypothetical protein
MLGFMARSAHLNGNLAKPKQQTTHNQPTLTSGTLHLTPSQVLFGILIGKK